MSNQEAPVFCEDCIKRSTARVNINEGTRVFARVLAIVFGLLLAAALMATVIQSEEISRPACATAPTAEQFPTAFQGMCIQDAVELASSAGLPSVIAGPLAYTEPAPSGGPEVVFTVEAGVVIDAQIRTASLI